MTHAIQRPHFYLSGITHQEQKIKVEISCVSSSAFALISIAAPPRDLELDRARVAKLSLRVRTLCKLNPHRRRCDANRVRTAKRPPRSSHVVTAGARNAMLRDVARAKALRVRFPARRDSEVSPSESS